MKLSMPAPASFDFIFLNDTQLNMTLLYNQDKHFIEADLRDKKSPQ